MGRREESTLRTPIVLGLLTALVLVPISTIADASSKPLRQDIRPGSSAMSDSERLVVAFYYAWFDENTWRPGVVADMPATTYHSADRNAIARHVDQAKGAGIDALILSWLGPNNPTDSNLATLLSVAQEKGLRVSLDFETNSPFLGSQEVIVNALKYAIDKYAGHPNFLRHQGKPVIFFWHTRQLSVSTWQQIRNQVDPNRSTVWIAEGDIPSYLQAFDGIHMYSIAWSQNVRNTLASFAGKVDLWANQLGSPKLWVATVMPGYDDRTTGRPDAFVRDRQDGQYYVSTWNAAMATSPDWIVITSFNEWVEGSQIEPSVTYGDKYLNLTREMSAAFKSSPRSEVAARGSDRPPASSNPSALDFDVPNGHFYTQANGQPPGASQAGFAITNDDGVRFWDEYQRLGGVQGLGYPISQRFQWNGLPVQVTQKGVLQWHPDIGQAYLVNVFDQITELGKDDWLFAARSTPKPLGPEFDAGKNWDEVVRARLALLDANLAIKRRYFSVSDPLTIYGLPTSRVEDFGNNYAVRLQRAVIQQWKEDVPWAKAGQVTVANGGDVGKEVGLYPAEVLAPRDKP